MDSFEWNKIFGGILATVLFVLVVKLVAESVFHVEPLEKQAYVVQGVEQTATTSEAAAPAVEPVPDWNAVIPAADLAAGEALVARCVQCHDMTSANTNKIGPGLWETVGRAKGTHAGYAYSAAMKAKGGDWSYTDLFHFLKMPAAFVPGTKMAFAGIPKVEDRVNLIAHLRTLAASPAALPPPAPEPAPAPAGESASTEQTEGTPADRATPNAPQPGAPAH
jgi:cytochrome c